MKSILSHRYIFWALLAVPMVPMIVALSAGSATPEDLLHPTGEYAARFMVAALMVTPLQTLFPKAKWPLWLLRRRRALGLAAFGYALLHTVLYLIDMNTFAAVWAEIFALGIWTGWLAFAVFVPLAITSNNRTQRVMGRWWKKLQRWVYVAALLTLVHWIFIHNSLGGALFHFVPLAALQMYRIYRTAVPRR